MPIRSRMSSIMGQIEPELWELIALEFGKIAESDFVYTLLSTNINQSAPNLARMHAIIRSRMSSIMDLIGLELPKLSALCYVHTQLFLALYMCVFILNGFPCGYFYNWILFCGILFWKFPGLFTI